MVWYAVFALQLQFCSPVCSISISHHYKIGVCVGAGRVVLGGEGVMWPCNRGKESAVQQVEGLEGAAHEAAASRAQARVSFEP